MLKHLPTIKEIAQALNVSVSTVSRALQDDPRIGLRTKMRVQEKAQQLHYIPNQAAKHLRQHRSFTVGILMPQLHEEFFVLALEGIEDTLEGTGYQVYIVQSRDKQEREISAIHLFMNSRVDGVIASISAETIDSQHFLELQDFGIPIVFFDRVPKNFHAHKVRSDIETGTEKAIHYLLGKDLRKIVLLNGPASLEISQERLRGFHRTMTASGIEVSKNHVKFTSLNREEVGQKMQEILHDWGGCPEAILAFNDYVSLYAMHWCKNHGIVPNRDLVFASYANLPITDYLDNPPVVSVEQFAYKMGRQAATTLLDILQKSNGKSTDFQEIILETELILHTSR